MTTLYVIPGSHPSRAVTMMLDRKGVEYRRIDLVPVISKGVVRVAGFPGVTVPALKIDGRKVQGSREIARELDRLYPEPPLLPADPQRRASVEEAEAWGEQVLQPLARRVFWNALRRDRSPLVSYSQGARLGIPAGLAAKTAGPIVALSARFHEADDDRVRADLAALPGMLQRIDDWIAQGVLGADPPTAADLQIATSLRLMITLEDLRGPITSRPAGQLTMRLVPDYAGSAPPVLPAAWLEPLRRAPG